MYGRDSDVYKILVRKHEGSRPLARPKRRWEDNRQSNISLMYLGRFKLQYYNFLSTTTNFVIKKNVNCFTRRVTLLRWNVLLRAVGL